jgi:hypothetical protein
MDEQATGTQRLWLDDVVVAASSWDVDEFGRVISLDKLAYDYDYDEYEVRPGLLCDCCGGDYPDYSRPAWDVVTDVLGCHEDEIADYMAMDQTEREVSTLLADLQAKIQSDAAKRIAEIKSRKTSK